MYFPIIPYQMPGYFFIILITMMPMAICLLKGHRAVPYQIFLTVGFLSLNFGGATWKEGIALLVFTAYQLILAVTYNRYRLKRNKRSVFFVVVFLAIIPLVIIKASSFLPAFTSSWGFLGISYITFRSLQVLLETRDALIKKLEVGIYLRFLLFFPTISSGPIDRYRNFLSQSTKVRLPIEVGTLIFRSIHLIFIGLLYKFILGTLLGVLLPYAHKLAFDGGVSILGLFVYMYVYSLYLFFDFAGYSLFAIGTAGLMGYEIPPNFNMPFISVNIKDFWNRWHMSLSFWFRDYVYMRLLLSITKTKRIKSRVLTSNLCYFCLFLLMGLWHGFTWYYVAYGLYHALLICLTDAWIRFKKKREGKLPKNKFTKILSIVLTFHTICFGFLIFSGF